MNEEKMVPDSELAAIVRDVQPEEGFEFHRVQEGYPDGVPRAVFIGPDDDEPIGIQMSREAEPLRFLVGRLAADLAAARGGIELVYLANKGLGEEVATLRTENAKSAAALAHARNAAHGLYQAAGDLVRWFSKRPSKDEDLAAVINVLRRALDPAEAEACACEAARRDGLGEENMRLRREVGVHKGEAASLRVEVARLRAPLPEVDAEELWTDYRTERGAVFANERKAFLAGVEAARRTRAPQSAPDASERPNRMNKSAYAQLIAENIAWCEAQPRTLERDHTIMVLRESVDAHYPPSGQPMPSTPDASLKERAEGALRAWRNNGSISDVVDLSSWLAVVRYVDASRPGLNEEEARPDDRVSMDSELARAVRDTLGETTHYGVMERIEELLDVEKESASRGDVPAEVRAVSPTDRPTDAANGSAIMEAAVVLGEEPPTQPPRREQIEALCKEAILDTGKGMHGHAIGCLVKAIRHMNEAP